VSSVKTSTSSSLREIRWTITQPSAPKPVENETRFGKRSAAHASASTGWPSKRAAALSISPVATVSVAKKPLLPSRARHDPARPGRRARLGLAGK
jgi:hypothetical protein